MGTFFSIHSPHGTERLKWRSLIEALPVERRDVHLLPEYALIEERAGRGEAHIATYQDKDGGVLMPFLLRDLRTLPFLANEDTAYRDIASPYGLGGPVVWGERQQEELLHQRFDTCFRNWCLQQGIASEFLCLNTLVNSTALVQDNPAYTVQPMKQAVVMDLGSSPEHINRQMRKGHKAALAQARKKGVTVKLVEPTEQVIAECHTLYTGTMDRNSAAQRWYFPLSFLHDHFFFLKQEIKLFGAYVDEALVAFLLLLHFGNNASYQYAGNSPLAGPYRAMTLLIYEAALWAQKNNLKNFYMGGGRTQEPDDSLLAFKRGFSREGFTFSLAWRKHDTSAYEQLAKKKILFENQCKYIPKDPDFFPIYRR